MALSVLNEIPPRGSSFRYTQLQPETNFPGMVNDGVIRTARGETVSPTPVWVMRQAGRYLPEFQSVRASHDFFSMCQTPALACEVTLQPIRRFALDAAIIFSDILVIPQAMGMEVVMTQGVGPQFPKPLESPEDLQTLKKPSLETDFEVYFDSIYLTRHSLCGKVPLFGFVGGPFTLLAYMIEGGGSETFPRTRRWMSEWPEATHQLLALLTEVISEFCLGQICAGAQIVQVFESHAGVLTHAEFLVFSLPYLSNIASFLHSKSVQNPLLSVPTVVFARGANDSINELMSTEFNVIGLDWKADIEQAKELASRHGKTLQGNLNPKVLHLTETEIREQTTDMMRRFAGIPHIANLGHGIEPSTDLEHMRVFVEAVHAFSQ